jgi:hypothetical protein
VQVAAAVGFDPVDDLVMLVEDDTVSAGNLADLNAFEEAQVFANVAFVVADVETRSVLVKTVCWSTPYEILTHVSFYIDVDTSTCGIGNSYTIRVVYLRSYA